MSARVNRPWTTFGFYSYFGRIGYPSPSPQERAGGRKWDGSLGAEGEPAPRARMPETRKGHRRESPAVPLPACQAVASSAINALA